MAKKTSKTTSPARANPPMTPAQQQRPAGRRVGKKATGEKALANALSGRDWLIVAGLAIVTLAVYAQVVGHQFIGIDDDLYINENRMVAEGLTSSGIRWAFTTFHATNYHPLTWLSHMLDSQLFGMVAGRHLLVNALLHTASTLLLFFFLRRVTRAAWQSAMVAALFALHPLHVESVAWAAERKDTLSTCFAMLTLLAYARYVQAPSPKRFALVAVALGLGLLAKPMLVTLPFVLLLLDYWPLRRWQWQMTEGSQSLWQKVAPLVREKLPLFALTVASMVVTYLAQAAGGAVRSLADQPLPLRVGNALVSYAKYVLLTFYPRGLGVYYPFSEDLPLWQIVGALLLLVLLTIFALRQMSKRPYLLVGWLWFLGTLAPVIGLVQVGGQAMADRYHYLPSVGLFMALVFGVADWLAARRVNRAPVAAGAALVLLLLTVLTWRQVGLWRDSETLFRHTLAVTADNLVIEYNLGHVLGRQGRREEAAAHFARALAINPNFYDALINLGVTLAEQGKPAEAIDYYERALRVRPTAAKAHMQMGLALVNLGKPAEALPRLTKAQELAPEDADVRTNLGLLLARQGRIPEALDHLHEALRLEPRNAEALNNLGLVLLAQGKAAESIPYFSSALQFKPGLVTAQENLKRAQAMLATQRQ